MKNRSLMLEGPQVKTWQKFFILILLCLMWANFAFGQKPDARNLELVVQTGHSSKIKNIWLSKDGKNLVSSSEDRTIIWEVNSETSLRAFEKETVKSISADEKVILTRDDDGVYSLWEMKTGKKL